jgi:hypothetical protein
MIPQYLTEDIYSSNRKIKYGTKGERVYIVSNRYPAVIVQKENGIRFACSVHKLKLKP